MKKKVSFLALLLVLCMALSTVSFAAAAPANVSAKIKSAAFSAAGLYVKGESVSIVPKASGAAHFTVAVWKGEHKTGTKLASTKNVLPGASVSFTPTAAGKYTVHVIAYNDGKSTAKNVSFNVVKEVPLPTGLNAAVKSATFNKSGAYVTDENLKVTPSASGAVKYRVAVWKGAFNTGTRMYVEDNVAPDTVVKYKPTAAGKYTIHVIAYNAVDKSVSKNISINVVKPSGSSSSSAASTIKYKQVRYINKAGQGTDIWFAVIPASCKMHYAYGKDKVLGTEKPSENAQRHQAVLAVNAQFLGFPTVNGQKIGEKVNVSAYDFYVKKNTSSTKAYDSLNVFAVEPSDSKAGISFKDLNLGFKYEGNYVKTNGYCSKGTLFMSVYQQVVKNGKITPSPVQYLKDRHPRTWIAYDSKGTQYVAVCAGRNAPLLDGTKRGQNGLDYKEMVEVTKKYMTSDIQTLYNLDGGGSTSFVYKGKKISPNYDENNTVERSNYGMFYWK